MARRIPELAYWCKREGKEHFDQLIETQSVVQNLLDQIWTTPEAWKSFWDIVMIAHDQMKARAQAVSTEGDEAMVGAGEEAPTAESSHGSAAEASADVGQSTAQSIVPVVSAAAKPLFWAKGIARRLCE